MPSCIRLATKDDCKAILGIYEYYVINTAITFEYAVPNLQEMEKRWESVLSKYPYLVYERDNKIIGYAYAQDFRTRTAYQWSPESTIYLSIDKRGYGIGAILYQALLDILRLQGFYNVFAGVAIPNDASIQLHKKLGFEEAGIYKNIGFKNGTWHTTKWLQCVLQAYPETPDPPRRILDIVPTEEWRTLMEKVNNNIF